MFAKHLLCNLLDIVNRVADMNPRLEAILSEVTLCARSPMHLSLDHELSIKVRPELPSDDECFFRCECHSAQWDGYHVFVDKLGCLVLMHHVGSLLDGRQGLRRPS